MEWIEDKVGEFIGEVRTLRLCLRFLIQHPPVALPLLGAWFAAVAIVFWGIPAVPWRRLDPEDAVLAALALVAAVNLVILFGCSMLLEFLQHQETGQPLRMGRAFVDTLFRNGWALVPLAAIWAIVQLWICMLEVLLRRGDRRSSPAAERVFDVLHKAVRMSIFLALPALAWESSGPVSAIRRGSRIIRRHLGSFLGAIAFSGIFSAIVGLPLAIGWWVWPEWMRSHLPVVIAAAAVVWTLKIYLEQMMMAELYLWARCGEWDEFRKVRDPLGKREAPEEFVPSLFNGVPDLKERMHLLR